MTVGQEIEPAPHLLEASALTGPLRQPYFVTVGSPKYLAPVKQEGLPGASLLPFKIALSSYVRTNLPYLFPFRHLCLPPSPLPPSPHHHQHLVAVSFPTTSLRSLEYFSFVPLFPQTPRSPSLLSFVKNRHTSFPISTRPYFILVTINSDILPIFIFCNK